MQNYYLNKFWENDEIANMKSYINIILLAHVYEPRGYNNSNQLQCSDIEHFTIEEFNQIYRGIVDAGYFVKFVYYNELDFINYYIANPKEFENCLIYNLTRNGIKNNKKIIIPAFCELVGLAYTSSSSVVCALCRNKYYFSILLNSVNIPTPKCWLFESTTGWHDKNVPKEGTVVIRKPCHESASQGITKSSVIEFKIEDTINLTGEYLFQEYINGEECEVPVISIKNETTAFEPVGINLLGEKILTETNSDKNKYDFYSLADTQGAKNTTVIKNYSIKAFDFLKMSHYGRIDFRIDLKGNPYVIDIATTPYTTKHSSFAYSFKKMKYEYKDIYEAIIASSLL